MRLVVVDVGNTSTAVGLWSGGRVTRVRHIDGENAGIPCRRTELLASSAPAYHAGVSRPAAFAAAEALASRAEALAYVSVVPKADAGWRTFARRIGKPLISITHHDFPLRLDYPKPETIGADRLADAAAAVDRYGAPQFILKILLFYIHPMKTCFCRYFIIISIILPRKIIDISTMNYWKLHVLPIQQHFFG